MVDSARECQPQASGITPAVASVQYMVIERYLSGPGPVYERAAACGRMLPEGLVYVTSWVVGEGGMDQCFQLMETSDPALFDVWFERWDDLVSFQVYPLITSAEAATRTGTAPASLTASLHRSPE